MNKILKDILIYTYSNYPISTQLGISRLMKVLFISDWYHIRSYREPICDFSWKITSAGPYSAPSLETLMELPSYFEIKGSAGANWRTSNMSPDILIIFNHAVPYPVYLPENTANILDKIIFETCTLNWTELWQYMYSNTPISFFKMNEEINLMDKVDIVLTPQAVASSKSGHISIDSTSPVNSAQSDLISRLRFLTENKESFLSKIKAI